MKDLVTRTITPGMIGYAYEGHLRDGGMLHAVSNKDSRQQFLDWASTVGAACSNCIGVKTIGYGSDNDFCFGLVFKN